MAKEIIDIGEIAQTASGEVTNKHIAIWLFVCCAMVVLMVAIGGVTRLTDSGLSMTDWKPITGWLPPLTENGWIAEFAQYRQSPEYKHINFGMSLEEFKGIFWLEYIHRVAGRITGLVFFVPLAYFLYRKALDKELTLKLLAILALGGSQAVVGWLMVSSGLKDAPHVSQYWLAFHLCMAFIIFAGLFCLGLGQYYKNKPPQTALQLKNFSLFLTALIFIQTFLGGLVAGLDAGLIYNTFPLMEGKVIPNELITLQPWYMNFFENIKTVQFTHRIMALIVSLFVVIFWFRAKDSPIKQVADLLIFVLCLQFTLGVLTLLYAVPITLASLHQLGALLLFSVALYINYTMLAKR